MSDPRRKPWVTYALTTAGVALAAIVSVSIQYWTDGRVPFMPFFPVILITAIYAGPRAGLLSCLLSATIAPFLFIHSGSAPISAAGIWIPSLLFFLIGCSIVGVCYWALQAQRLALSAQATTRTQEQMTLAKAQELETVMRAVPAAIFIAHDPKCQTITGSSFAYQLMEVPEGQNVSVSQSDPPSQFTITFPDGRPFSATDMPLQKAATLGESQRGVRFDIHTASGKVKALYGNAEPLFDGNGKIRGAVAAFVDVTSVIEADRAASAAGERFRTMADTAPVLVWIDDKNKQCVWLNKPWLEFTGHSLEQDSGLGWTEVVHPDDLKIWQDTYNASFETQTPFTAEYRIRRADGEWRWIIDHGVPLYEGPGGEFSGFIGSCIDITERKHMEEQKAAILDAERAARMESERIGRLKDEFLATLSHELRTPLSAILGWSQLLTRGETDQEHMKQGLDAISRNARAQTQMIEDLLDMSRIISGKIRLNVQRVELADVVEAAIESVLPSAGAKGVRLLKVLDPLAGQVSGDPGRLQQVAWNLLSNAIKFTPPGGKVEIVLARINAHVELTVTDTGAGIKPEFLPYVFDRFRQDDGSTTRKHGGLGLGLSIVKQLVELHGATVRAHSDGEDKGTTFVVTFPVSDAQVPTADGDGRVHPTTPTTPAMYDTPKLSGVKILVVDDDRDTRTIIERILLSCEADVTVAASAEEGLERLKTTSPEVIVSDIGMPMVDGYEFMRRVRALPAEDGGSTPALALTAFARSEDRQRALMAGYHMHMSKPVEPAELVIACASLLGRRTPREPQRV